MRVIVFTAVLLLGLLAMPNAAAGPENPGCYDRGPVVDGGIVQVWLTRGCQPKLVVNEPTCTVGELYICP